MTTLIMSVWLALRIVLPVLAKITTALLVLVLVCFFQISALSPVPADFTLQVSPVKNAIPVVPPAIPTVA